MSLQTPLETYRRAIFSTNRVRLRPALEQDQDLMFSWRSDADTSRFLSSEAPKTIENQRQWFEEVRKDTSYSYHIVEDQGVPIGYASMFNADPETPEAEWGLVIGKKREPGDVRIIAPLCCRSVFRYGGLEAIYTPINEKNTGAIRRVTQLGARLHEEPNVYRKAGELLYRIGAEDFEQALLTFAETYPELTEELDFAVHIADTAT